MTSFLHTEHVLQFVAKLFDRLSLYLSVKNLPTSTYPTQKMARAGAIAKLLSDQCVIVYRASERTEMPTFNR